MHGAAELSSFISFWLASVSGDPKGIMLVMQPMIARTTQKNLDRGYARLKSLLETGSAA